MLRICYLRHFGYSVAKMKTIRFHYEADKGVFYGPVQLQSQEQDQMAAQQNMVSLTHTHTPYPDFLHGMVKRRNLRWTVHLNIKSV